MTNNCTCCFYDYVVKCDDNIRVNAKLAPTTEYTWVITDKFNRQYQGTATTNADGYIDIPVADLPGGLLTEFSGDFSLKFYLAADLCTPVNFLIAQSVDCIDFNVRAGTREKNFLGCEFPD